MDQWGKFGLEVTTGSCSILPDSKGQSPKEMLFIGTFLVPCLSIMVCCAGFIISSRTQIANEDSEPTSGATKAVASATAETTGNFPIGMFQTILF